MTIKLPLREPVQAHGQTITELTLRPPTGKDYRTCGVPYQLTTTGAISIDAPSMARMIAQCSDVPPSTIDKLSASDWHEASQIVLGFIMGSTATATPAPDETMAAA